MKTRRAPLKLCDDWDPLFPIQAFFNAISDASLLDIVTHLTRRQGYSSDYCHCRFPSDLDPDEACFDGVRFSHFDSVAVMTETQFADVLDRVGKSYGEAHPAKAHRMNALVSSFRQSINEQAPTEPDQPR